MFGKHFSSMYEGSMMGAGPVVFAVWGYVISKAFNGQVELNPRLVSVLIGCDVAAIEEAIEYLCLPDPNSRNKEDDGKRLVKTGQFAYRVVSHHIYQSMRNEADRREYNRIKQAEYRAAERAAKQSVPACTGVYHDVPQCTHTDVDVDVDVDVKKRKLKKKKDSVEFTPAFLSWWDVYPVREGKQAAAVAHAKAIKAIAENEGISVEAAGKLLIEKTTGLLDAIEAKRDLVNDYRKQPATWLNQGCYDDEPRGKVDRFASVDKMLSGEIKYDPYADTR